MSRPWVYVWLFWLPLEKDEMVDIILPCDRPTTTLLINLLSESAVSCLLRVRSVSFTSREKGRIKFVPSQLSGVPFTQSRRFPRGSHLLFYLCQIRSHVRILIIIGYYTLLYNYNFNPIKNNMVVVVFRN